jgi:pyridoxal phosphate enzyme (YggS family)
MTSISENIESVLHFIRKCEVQYGREKNSVMLLAVSKSQPLEKILDAYDAGQRCFGENYLQEALLKIQQTADKNIEWHFIGTMQNNKTKKIAENFHWVHTVSSLTTAVRLSEQRPQELGALNVCLQVNISKEASKSGVAPEEVEALARGCLELSGLRLRGLMTIATETDDVSRQLAEFRQLADLQRFLGTKGISLDTLSMGMSHDLEAAIAEGSTVVRIGTSIFGERG